MVERESKQVRAIKIDNAKTNIIHNQVVSNVEQNSTICTDSYVAYHYLHTSYNHSVINHEKGQYVDYSRQAFKIHTNTIEGFWSQLKRGIYGIYHWVSKKHIQRYLGEYTFRYNTKTLSDFDRFNQWFNVCETNNLTYKNLING